MINVGPTFRANRLLQTQQVQSASYLRTQRPHVYYHWSCNV